MIFNHKKQLSVIFSGLVFIAFSLFSLNAKAQKSQNNTSKTVKVPETSKTSELIQQIKVLLPYQSAKLKADYTNLPLTLTVSPKNYEGLQNYSVYLIQTFDNGEFTNFSETCLNHIASRKIKNPENASFFKPSPTSKPVIID